MRLLLLLALSLALAAPAPGQAGEVDDSDFRAGDILVPATGERLTPDALAARLAAADVVILGEVHDNPVHHRRQAWLIGEIGPGAVAFEMVPDAAEEALAALRAEAPSLALDSFPEALGWAESGWPDWELYRPVFEALGVARIVGAGVAREDLMRAVSDGAAAAFGEGAALAGLDAPLAGPEQAAVVEEMRVSHCDALPPEMLPGMVEAQRLRDARFAAAVLRARVSAGPAVLIAGNGHARTDRGVPAYLARMAPQAEVLSLGQVEIGEGSTSLDGYRGADGTGLPYDFVWFSEPAERPDPCAAFEERPAD